MTCYQTIQSARLFSAIAVLFFPTLTFGQLSLDEAQKVSAETGRTMFVVAGKKT